MCSAVQGERDWESLALLSYTLLNLAVKHCIVAVQKTQHGFWLASRSRSSILRIQQLRKNCLAYWNIISNPGYKSFIDWNTTAVQWMRKEKKTISRVEQIQSYRWLINVYVQFQFVVTKSFQNEELSLVPGSSKYFRFGKVNFIVGILIEIVGKVCVFTFFEAGFVFVESCKQIFGSLPNVIVAACALRNKYDRPHLTDVVVLDLLWLEKNFLIWMCHE